MAGFDTNIERLESNPPRADRAPIYADIAKARGILDGIVDELTELSDLADYDDEPCAREVLLERVDATGQYAQLMMRLTAAMSR
jgi:hypothetical protein